VIPAWDGWRRPAPKSAPDGTGLPSHAPGQHPAGTPRAPTRISPVNPACLNHRSTCQCSRLLLERFIVTILEVLIALFLPPLAVAMKKGLSSKVLIALVLQLCGHIPGVIYGIYVVTQE